MGKAWRILISVGAGLVVAPLAAFMAFFGSSTVVFLLANLIAPLFGVQEPVLDHLGSPVTELLFGTILVVSVGAGVAAGVYSAVRAG